MEKVLLKAKDAAIRRRRVSLQNRRVEVGPKGLETVKKTITWVIEDDVFSQSSKIVGRVIMHHGRLKVIDTLLRSSSVLPLRSIC